MIPCGFFEEGTGLAFNCYTSRRTFGRLSPRIEINQIFEELSYCDSNGTCHDNDPSRYRAIYASSTDKKNVTLLIKTVTRDLKKVRCYLDDLPYSECVLAIYIAPAKPICSGPEFVEDGRAAIVTCSSDPVYPTARCEVMISYETVRRNVREQDRMSIVQNLTDSEQYPGNKKLTCRFKVQLTDIVEGLYQLDAQVYVPVPGQKTNITKAHTSLELKAITLENPDRGSRQITVTPKPQELKVNISVISNPPPNSFSLAVSHDESQTPVIVPSHLFSVQYSSRGDTDLKGTIELSVLTAAVTVHERFNYFIFSASNGVVGSRPTAFKIKFTWIRLDVLPTQPTCDAPVFVDEGATALITCTADRVYPSGVCSFELTAHSQSVDVPPYIRTRNNDSTAYLGQQTVTCELRLPVAGNRAGEYQFQVEITPNIIPVTGNQSVFATTPTVNLANATLQGHKSWKISLLPVVGGAVLILIMIIVALIVSL
ncbi:hypothetical protein RRG08_056545 [Elysia crispata]|uniref:Uncharacterized protein n=1 Tax=Elysia crispata TaxID=231223 RepID=A0AAE1BCM4_9GAST|nr:hypothetical protein RRG08_056545 [Elysia crispata]